MSKSKKSTLPEEQLLPEAKTEEPLSGKLPTSETPVEELSLDQPQEEGPSQSPSEGSENDTDGGFLADEGAIRPDESIAQWKKRTAQA